MQGAALDAAGNMHPPGIGAPMRRQASASARTSPSAELQAGAPGQAVKARRGSAASSRKPSFSSGRRDLPRFSPVRPTASRARQGVRRNSAAPQVFASLASNSSASASTRPNSRPARQSSVSAILHAQNFVRTDWRQNPLRRLDIDRDISKRSATPSVASAARQGPPCAARQRAGAGNCGPGFPPSR